jgi:hypothetical protein
VNKSNIVKSLYIGGGFRDHQILYMIPIIDGTCKRYGIKKIIFEKKISKKILNLKLIQKILKNYEIVYEENLYFNTPATKRFLNHLLLTFYFFFKSFFKSEILLSKKDSWLDSQIKHALWDTGIRNNINALDKIEFRSRIRASRLIALKYFKTKKIIEENIIIAFIQHVVYQYRVSFALLRQKAKVIVQNKNVLILQSKNKDYGFKYLDKKIFKKSKRLISDYVVEKYWSNFLKGNSKYMEARNASRIKDKKKNIIPNVIMLHVFRDSPFTNLDRSRIFPDYYTWVVETLKIIKNSDEKWVIRSHPSAKRWGEKQDEIIKQIFKKHFDNKVPKNIKYENNESSNISQIKKSNRLITFSGNSHLEAACFGVKPIVISNTTLCDYNKNLFFQPKTLKEYKSLLIENSNHKKFKLKKNQIKLCKRILFLIQCCINFGNDIGSFHLFKSDPKSLFLDMFLKIKTKIQINHEYLNNLGFTISERNSQSINKKYFKSLINN